MNKEYREYMQALKSSKHVLNGMIKEQYESLKRFAEELSDFIETSYTMETESYYDLNELFQLNDPDTSIDMLSEDITDEEADNCYNEYEEALNLLYKLNEYREISDAVLEELEVILTGENYLGWV